MKSIHFIGITLLLILLGGCATSVTEDIQIEATADTTTQFGHYKSYTWLGDIAALNDPEGIWQPPKINVAENIKFLIDRELRKRGIFNYAENAELQVVFFMGVDMEAMELKVNPDNQQDILEIVPAASLAVALIDAKTGFVVWVGEATGDIHKNASEDTIRKRLDYAVTEIFKKLPKE
jgi:Domain of unknown function (DUF4136)